MSSQNIVSWHDAAAAHLKWLAALRDNYSREAATKFENCTSSQSDHSKHTRTPIHPLDHLESVEYLAKGRAHKHTYERRFVTCLDLTALSERNSTQNLMNETSRKANISSEEANKRAHCAHVFRIYCTTDRTIRGRLGTAMHRLNEAQPNRRKTLRQLQRQPGLLKMTHQAWEVKV